MEVSYQGYTIPSALHNLHGDVISSLHRLILSPPPSRRCQIKCTSSVPHSSAFVEVLDRHAFLTPPRLRCHFKSTPSIHHSTTFVEVSHHVYTILSSLRNLSRRYESNQVYTIYSIYSSLHNFRGGTCQVKFASSSPHSTTFVEVGVKSSLHHPFLTLPPS